MSIYYGLVDKESNSYGFVSEGDTRYDESFILISNEYYNQLLTEQSEGKEIVYYNGQVFATEYGKYYVDENGVWCIRTDEEVAKNKRLAEIDIELTKADEDYTTQLDTPIQYTNGHWYKPKWAEETYISLLSAGNLMPTLFPQVIWDSTELEENAVEMTLEELTQLTAYLANIQQTFFNTRKAVKSALLTEKEQLLSE